jgi:hypothetical protein
MLRSDTADIKAGLLAPPPFSAAFPTHFFPDQWHTEAEKGFLAKRGYSGGTAPDSNGIPY